MRLPASKIAIADPICPSCASQVAGGDPICPSCGFGFEFAITLLPYQAPPLRKFIDFDRHLSRSDIKRGHRALARLQARFPQVTLCTCISKIPDGIGLTEFGFWLFNQSRASGPELSERRLHSILLTIDPQRAEAALTVGYGLDPFIDDAALERCLTKIRRELAATNYGKAIEKLCSALQPVLARGHDLGSVAISQHLIERKRMYKAQRQTGSAPAAPPKPQTRRSLTQKQDTHA